MKAFSIILIGLVALAGWVPEACAKGEIEKRTYDFQEAGKEMEYQLYVPSHYTKSKKYPLVVVLHGLGSTPSQVIRYAGIIEEAEARGYIVAAPFGYNERGWYGSMGPGVPGREMAGNLLGDLLGDPENLGELSEKDVLNVLAIVRENYNVDENRIYLMGHSMGGGGTFHLGTKYPDLWAGLAPLSPALFGQPSIPENARDLPVMVVTGERDRLVAVSNVRRWVKKMEELEMDYVYNEIKGGNHFNTISRNPEMMAGVFDFFDERSRAGMSDTTASPIVKWVIGLIAMGALVFFASRFEIQGLRSQQVSISRKNPQDS